MCGILVSIKNNGNIDKDKFAQALRFIDHRGPDSHGSYFNEEGNLAIGHTRLSILDLSTAGAQPMTSFQGRYVICYNGEVYNYQTLKKDITEKYGFNEWSGNSDTEVILQGVEFEGVKFLNKLNGDFAIVIYDKQTKIIYALRDPVGKKPLFYSVSSGEISFCSEISGIVATGVVTRSLDTNALAEQLSFMYVTEPNTLYSSIKKFKPGILYTFKETECVEEISLFEDLKPPVQILENPENDLRRLILESVERQVVSDVPVGLFLSGGLDSSIVAAALKETGKTIHSAYTISLNQADLKKDGQSDDLYYAKKVAELYGIKLKVVDAKRDFLSDLPNLIQYMEDGFTDPAALNTYILSSFAKNDGVSVVLTGQGADEYLGGYRRYLVGIKSLGGNDGLRKIISLLLSCTPVNILPLPEKIKRRINRVKILLKGSRAERLFGLYSWTSQDAVNQILSDKVSSSQEKLYKLFDQYSDREILDALMLVDHQYDLLSLNLTYTDRMSMAAGVEARVPLLDHELIRFYNQTPSAEKVKNMSSKHILKKAAEGLLPNEIIYREKAGFGLPLRAWLKGENEALNHYLDNKRIERQGIFNPSKVKQIKLEQESGKVDWSYTIMTLLCQQMLIDKFQLA